MHTYLSYVLDCTLGVVVSGSGQVAIDKTGHLAISPALEAVAVWQVKTGILQQRMVPDSIVGTVTALVLGTDGTIAVGYSCGVVRLWQLSSGVERLEFNGHKGAVQTLRMSRDATMLVSGANDLVAIVWDVVADAGICRLCGHRDVVTDVCLIEARSALASVSRDGTLRLWNLRTQHCMQSVAGPSGELWSVDVDTACMRILTGGAKAEVLSWKLESTKSDVFAAGNGKGHVAAADGSLDGNKDGSATWLSVRAVLHGPLGVRDCRSRVVRLRFALNDSVVAVQFVDRNLAIYLVRSEVRVQQEQLRRANKRGEAGDGGVRIGVEEISAATCYQLVCHVRTAHKLHSFAFLPYQQAVAGAGIDGDGFAATFARVLVAHRANGLELHVCALAPGSTSEAIACVEAPGHRTEPRCLAFSTDERFLISACDGEAKVWGLRSRRCVCTLPCGYGLSAAFVLASKYAVIGTKDGSLRAFSLSRAELVCEISHAHTAAIWTLAQQPRSVNLLSGSADKSVALWEPSDESGSFSLAASMQSSSTTSHRHTCPPLWSHLSVTSSAPCT